ncbi:MAG: PDZ domain-containing protein [Firmicutes bacterium]|nr:PDZ domain-containing protein [Bacillota bacterium]
MFNKNTQRKIALVLVWILVIALVVTTFSFSVFAAEEEVPDENAVALAKVSDTIGSQLKDMEEVLDHIDKLYVDEVDVDKLIDGAYEGIFEQLDPYSEYYENSDEGDDFMSVATGETYGIGVQYGNSDKGVVIHAFLTDSAAKKAGMQVGDIIVSVDGVSMKGKLAADAAAVTRSSKQVPVTIVADRNGVTKTFKFQRILIKDQSVTYKMVDDNTAYISISNFYSSTPEEFENAWNALKENGQQVSDLIVDVRNNPGGLVNSALEVSNYFLYEGCTIMNYVRQNTKVYTYQANGDKIIDVPVHVLVNKNTASAAEIFAGAVQDNYAGVLVGSETYGKGLAQTVTNLDNGASVKLSVYYFTTPDNHIIQGRGLTPSYIIYNGDNKTAIQKYNEMKTVAPMNEGKKYKAGEVGLNVYAAQQRLSILGYDVPLNGVLDTATQEAIKKVQAYSGVYVYGALDFTTIECLEKMYQQNVFGIAEDVQLNKAIELTN